MSGPISAPTRRVRHEVLDGVAVMAVSLGGSLLVTLLFLVATVAVGN